MDPIDQYIEQSLIAPLQAFQGRTSSLDANHHIAVQQFSRTVGALFTNPNPFSGSAADVVADLINQYLQTENVLTGLGSSDHLATMASTCNKAANNMEQCVESHRLPTGDSNIEEAAMAFAGTVDIGAVGQGGLDIPWDIVAIVASAVAAVIALGVVSWVCTQEETKLSVALEDVLIAKAVADQLKDTEEIPIIRPPTNPDEPPGSNLWKYIAVAMAIGGLGALAKQTWVQLQQDPTAKEAVLNYLRQKYGDECTDAQLLDFLDKNPNVSLQTLDKIMEFYRVRAQSNAIKTQIENSPFYNDPRYRADADALIKRLGANKLNNMALDDVLAENDDYFSGYANSVKGVWAEFQVGLRNLHNGLKSIGDTKVYSVSNPENLVEVDAILNDDGTDTWIQIKNNNKLGWYNRPYKDLLKQFNKTITIAKDQMNSGKGPITVEEDLPGGFRNDSDKQKIIEALQRIGANEGVNVKVNTDPIAALPSDKSWCQNLPANVPTSKPTPTPMPNSKTNPNITPGEHNLTPTPTPGR